MGYNQNKRNYRMSDSELVDFVRVLCQCITRDIVEFGEFSVTAADVTALSNLAIQFNNLPDDEYVHQEYLAAVEEKNIILSKIALHHRSFYKFCNRNGVKNNPERQNKRQQKR